MKVSLFFGSNDKLIFHYLYEKHCISKQIREWVVKGIFRDQKVVSEKIFLNKQGYFTLFFDPFNVPSGKN